MYTLCKVITMYSNGVEESTRCALCLWERFALLCNFVFYLSLKLKS